MAEATLSSKNQIVIPREAREEREGSGEIQNLRHVLFSCETGLCVCRVSGWDAAMPGEVLRPGALLTSLKEALQGLNKSAGGQAEKR